MHFQNPSRLLCCRRFYEQVLRACSEKEHMLGSGPSAEFEADDDDSESEESEEVDGQPNPRPSDASSSDVEGDDVAGCESVSDEEEQAYASAHSGSGDDADGTADAAVVSDPAAAAQQPSFEDRLQALGFRTRAPRAAPPRDELFQQWQAQRAERARDPPARERAGNGSSSEPAPPADDLPTPSTNGYTLPAPPLPPLQVAPPGPELEAQVAELMARDSEAAVALAMAIFRHLPTGALAAEAERVFGRAPDMLNAAATAIVEQPPLRLAVDVSGGTVTPIVRRKRCFACDDDDDEAVAAADRAGAFCAGVQLLNSLHTDLTVRDALVREEIANGADREATHRGARWFMYRTFVAAKYGHLGRGVRVRIPDCVIAKIRMRYPAPGCACNARAILTCDHGYAGHRDS